MVTRDTAWPPGTPCWIDLGVADKAKAKAFYGGLFGWSIQDGPPEAGGYSMCLIDGKAAAGIGDKQGPEEQPPYWTTYIATADADATAARVKAAGGQVLADPFDVMDVGRMAIAIDPGGAPFGIWEAKAHTGVGVANEPGALIWSENMSRDYEANKAFYGSVFGYHFSDIGGPGNVVDESCGIRLHPVTPAEYARDLAAAITRLADPRLRGLLGEGARARAAEVALWDSKVQHVEAIYAEVLAGRPAP